MWVDMSRPMAGNGIRFPSFHLSIVCPSLWKNVRLQPYLILVKVWKGRSQPHKSTRPEKDSKPLPWCFHSTKKESSIRLMPAQQNEETSWSALGLTCLASIPFYSSDSPSLRNKGSRTYFFSFWGFVSSTVLKRLSLPKWIGLVHHLFAKGSLFNRVHPPRMTSWLFGRTLICPSQMNCTFLLPCSLPQEISAGSCSHRRCVRSGARIWWIPPPKMYEIGTLEGVLKIVLSGFPTGSVFEVKSAVVF